MISVNHCYVKVLSNFTVISAEMMSAFRFSVERGVLAGSAPVRSITNVVPEHVVFESRPCQVG